MNATIPTSKSSTPTTESHQPALANVAVVVPLLFLATLLLIWANWNSPFYSYDDADHLQQATETPLAYILCWDNDATYLPIASLSLRLDRILFGPPLTEVYFAAAEAGSAPLDLHKFKAQRTWATASRLENALIHLLSGIVLWLFLRRIGVRPGVSFVVALAWTGHPMACESVCWISERKNVLSTMFGFVAMLSWTFRRNAWWRWPLVYAMYLLSVLSKPTGVGLFPILVALEFIPLSEDEFLSYRLAEFKRIALRLAAPFAVTVFIVWIGFRSHQVHFVEHAGGSLFNALLTDLEIFLRYIFNTIFPFNLSFFYGIEPIRSSGDWRVWSYGTFLLVSLTGMVWCACGSDRWLALLGIIWFFAALGPVSNIAPIPFWMHDRYEYFSSAGLLLAVASGSLGLLKRIGTERIASTCAALFLTVLLGAATMRSIIFAESELLCFDAASRFPNSCFALVNAYSSARLRIESLQSAPSPEAAKARDFYVKQASVYYESAIQRDDLSHFHEEFLFRVNHAELLLDNGRLEQALACLKGYLPPENLKMRALDQKFRAAEFKQFYAPQTLARAWLVHANVRLSQANPPGTPLLVLPVQRRIKLCDEAAESLAKSVAAFDWNMQVQFMTAAVNLTRSEIAKLDNKPEAAAKFLETARLQLEAIPPRSPYYPSARNVLTSLGVK